MQKNYSISRSCCIKKYMVFLLSVLCSFQWNFTQDRVHTFHLETWNDNKSNANSSIKHQKKRRDTIKCKQQPNILNPAPITKQVLHLTKKETIALCLGIGYVSIIGILYGILYTCDHHCPWAHWKQEMSIRQLQKIPQRELAGELFESLNTCYESELDQGDFLTPLVCFINALDREITWHSCFLSLHSWLDALFIFPKQKLNQIRIAKQYERLKFIRLILVTWLTVYIHDGAKTCLVTK